VSVLQVIDDEICFKHTEYESIVDLFNSRAQMHKKARLALLHGCYRSSAFASLMLFSLR
jgi:hypothetical protein